MKKFVLLLIMIMSLTMPFTACGSKAEVSPSVEETATPPSPSPSPSPSLSPSPTPSEEEAEEYDGYINPLTGEPVDEDISQKRPFAVMLNNTKVAMPQYGISRVNIFYEMLAEYGVTRIMGVFQDISDVGQIGSIRSVRSHFLDCAQGLDAILIHAGGSDMAYGDIKTRGVDHIDGVKGTGDMFYRDQERIASMGREHSMFTSSELIADNISNYSFSTQHGEGYSYSMQFADDGTPGGGSSAKAVEVVFSSYKTGLFEYSEDDRVYYISEYGQPYVDGSNGEQIGVKNVLVLYSDFTGVTGTPLLKTNLVGSGPGYYACGGKYVPITWSKAGYTEQFVYTLEDGTEVVFGRGSSYVNIVPLDTPVSFS